MRLFRSRRHRNKKKKKEEWGKYENELEKKSNDVDFEQKEKTGGKKRLLEERNGSECTDSTFFTSFRDIFFFFFAFIPSPQFCLTFITF